MVGLGAVTGVGGAGGAQDKQLVSGYIVRGMFSKVHLDIITIITTTTTTTEEDNTIRCMDGVVARREWGGACSRCVRFHPADRRRTCVAVVTRVQEGRFQLEICRQGDGGKVERTPEKHTFLRIAENLCYGRPQSYVVLGFSGAKRAVSTASEGMREPRSTTVFWLRS